MLLSAKLLVKPMGVLSVLEIQDLSQNDSHGPKPTTNLQEIRLLINTLFIMAIFHLLVLCPFKASEIVVIWFNWSRPKLCFCSPAMEQAGPKVCKFVNRPIDFTDIVHLPKIKRNDSFLAQTWPTHALPGSQQVHSLLSKLLWFTEEIQAIILS